MKTKRFKLVTLILTLIMAIMPLTTTACSLSDSSDSSKNYIEILNEGFVFNDSRIDLRVKVKNISSKTISVNFKCKYYLKEEVLEDNLSSTVTLDPNETTTLSAVGFFPAYPITDYSYKITGWNIYV